MSGPERNSREARRRPLTSERLRRLIEEGDVPRASNGDLENGEAHRRPSDAALRDLAAALRIAATTTASGPDDRAAREAAAVAAFRSAAVPAATSPTPATGSGGEQARQAARLRRIRRAVAFSFTAAVLGGGVAVAAGGGTPFMGASPGLGTSHPARPLPDAAPSPSATARTPGTHTRQPAAPHSPVTPSEHGTAEPSAPVSPPAALPADARALRAHCAARGHDATPAPRPLVVAAGGREHVASFCTTLLDADGTPPHDPSPATRDVRDPSRQSDSRPGKGPGKPYDRHEPRDEAGNANRGDGWGTPRSNGKTAAVS